MNDIEAYISQQEREHGIADMHQAPKKYIKICEGLADKGKLVPAEEFDFKNFVSDKDCYSSLYYFNDAHYDQFQKTGSVSGITDVVTDKVFFDFDCKENPNKALTDARELVSRLQKLGIDTNKNVQIHFTGNKGFSVLFKLDKMITPEEHQHIAVNVLGKGLETLDKAIYNAVRVVRIPNTKHQTTGLYKYPISDKQLNQITIDEVKKKAATHNRFAYKELAPVMLPDSVFKKETPKAKREPAVISGIDLKERPKHWKDYKWALLNAIAVQKGERKNAMMVIGSTCKALGYPEVIAESFLNTLDANYAQATGQGLEPGHVEDVLTSIYRRGTWNGGTYSIKSNPWLQAYVQRLGINADTEEDFLSIGDVQKNFLDFSENFEKNLVKTGIDQLDEKVLFLTSTHNGLLGQPGSGKTSFALQWLRNASESNSPAVFYSLDMAQPIVYGKLVQQEMGLHFKEAMIKYKKDRINANLVDIAIQNRYKNVSFNFRSGVTVEQIKDDVKRWEDIRGEKVRLLVIDYLECLQGPYSDQTANTGYISNQMKDLANELAVCSVMLLQTQKHSTGDVSDPLSSMKQVKGSSIIEQASSVILTLWREGYSPKQQMQDKDKYISFSVVKNRFGELWEGDFSWNGKNGVIDTLTDEDREALAELRKTKRANKEEAERAWK